MNRPNENSTCCTESLTLHHYGELKESDRLRTERHLQDCEPCRLELAQLRSDLEKLPKWEPEFSGEEIRAFNERVNRRVRPRFRFRLGVPLGLSAAGAVALLLIVLQSPVPGPGPQPPTNVALQTGGEAERFPDAELLMNMELLENLDLLQELEKTGISG